MEGDNRFSFLHEGMTLTYSKRDNKCIQHTFLPRQSEDRMWDYTAAPPFHVAVAGRMHGGLPAVSTAYTDLPKEMTLVHELVTETDLRLTYLHSSLGLEVTVESRAIPGTAVMQTVTTARNRSSEPITLTHLSSLHVQGIAIDGLVPWHNPAKIRVHYCRQSWAGEGQWRAGSLEDLGLYPTAKHSARGALHLATEGSWSAGRFAPMIVLEDLETSQVWYAQIETSSPWHFEVGVRGSIWDQGERALYLQADAASDRVGGWATTLQPGESFTSAPAAVGCCEGDFTDAVRQLTAYRRSALKLEMPHFGYAPVVFNDYMNCIWARPSRETLDPIITSAAKAGVEVFCIDAGWFGPKQPTSHRTLGDWVPSPDKFGEAGLQGILDFIRSQGMVPGVWLEMEVCGEDAELGQKPDDWFLNLRGKRVGGGDRWFLNFTHPGVREYLHGVIDLLVELGVGYIKNDYNACIGQGDDILGTSPADGLIRHIRGFYEFIDEVRHRHPKLILENCGCGAMRTDYGVQSHFHLASYSDQENYTLAPSILGGSLAFLLPEQLGVWAYPYPLVIDNNGKPEVLRTDEYRNERADGEETIFNLVNGLCGVITLSGRIEAADDLNFSLIEQGLSVYKRERAHVASAYPIWPLGMARIGDVDGWASVGLMSYDGNRLLLAVWRRETNTEICEVPLRGFAGCLAVVNQIYPDLPSYSVDTYYNRVKGTLSVRFPKQNQARFFEVRRVQSS